MAPRFCRLIQLLFFFLRLLFLLHRFKRRHPLVFVQCKVFLPSVVPRLREGLHLRSFFPSGFNGQ